MIDKNLQKTKVMTISALMGNEKLSRAITDGLKAPIGSSKRAKAASILNSFNKTYRLDGQGGGAVGRVNGTSGMNLKLDASGNVIRTSPATNVAGISGLPDLQPVNKTKTLNNVLFTAPPDPIKNQIGISGKLDASGNIIKTPTTPGVAGILGLQPVDKTKILNQLNQTKDQNGNVVVIDPFKDQTGNVVVIDPTKDSVGQGNNYIDNTNINQLPDTNLKLPPPPTISAGDAIDYWYKALSEAEKKRFKPLYEAQKAGIGAKTFTYNIMADKEKFKTMFPNVPEESLPIGASLVGQINALEASLKKQYKVDELANNLTKLSNRGLTITDDLKGYMTARDEYISTLDKMITDAQDRSLKTDMSNPTNREMNSNYMNYLYIMKGRQQKRYTDFLNSAINYHNQELSRAETSYNTAYNNFNSTLKSKSALVQEDYNRLSDMLGEMYDNVSSLESNETKKQKSEYDLWKSYYDILKTVNEANGTDADSINKTKIADNIPKLLNPATGKMTVKDYEIMLDKIGRDYASLLKWFNTIYPPQRLLDPADPEAKKWLLTKNQLVQEAEDESLSDWAK